MLKAIEKGQHLMEHTLIDPSPRRRARMNFKAVATLLALQLISAACPAEAAGGIKWYPGLSLGDVRQPSIDKWRTSLSQPWSLGGNSATFTIVDGGKSLTVDRCTRLFASVEAGVNVGGADQDIFNAWRISCHAVRVLVNALPARQSHLSHFTLDRKTIKALPAQLAFQVSPDDERRVAAITSRGGSLGDYVGSVTLKRLGKPGDRRMLVTQDMNYVQKLVILARGDFDHDGVDDLLISSTNSITDATYTAAHLYIVSRLSADGPLVFRKEVF